MQSQILCYCSLAAELERSGAGNSSSDLYKRAYKVASKFNVEKVILQELEKLIDLSGAQLSFSNIDTIRPPEKEIWTASPAAPSFFSDTVDRTSSSGRWYSPPGQNKELPIDAIEINYQQQVSHPMGKTRPQSALPRMVQNQANGDSWNLFNENGMATSTIPFREDNARRRNEAVAGNEIYDPEALRPKSAVSKLGGGYNNPPSINPSTNELNSIPTTPQSGYQNSDSTGPQTKQLPPKQKQSIHNNRPPAPSINPNLSHSVILLPPSPGNNKNKKTGIEENIPSSSSSNGQKTITVSKKEKVPHGVVGIAGDSNAQPLSIPLKSSANTSNQDEILINTSTSTMSKHHELRPEDDAVLVPPLTSSNTSKTNKTPISKAMLFAQLHQQQEQLDSFQPPLPVHLRRKATSTTPLNTTNITNITATTNPAQKVQPPNPLLVVDEYSREKLKRISHALFPYFKGMQIEAKYQVHRLGDRGRWYPGRIIKADFVNGLYDVEFDNGDREKDVFVDNIRIPEHASKMALLQQRGGKQKQTIASQKPSDGSEKENTADKRLPARVIRTQNIDDMHTHMKKLLAGINQRTDLRKIERVTRKNECITKVQALLRGVLCRHRFPKIRHQLTKEIELLRKEKSLHAFEAKILAQQFLSQQLQEYLTQQIEEEDEFLSHKAMEIMFEKQSQQVCMEVEIQTGGSLFLGEEEEEEQEQEQEQERKNEEVGVQVAEEGLLEGVVEPQVDRMVVEEIALAEPVGRYMSRPMLYIQQSDQNDYSPSNGRDYTETLPEQSPVVDHNAYLQYLQQYQDTLAASDYQHSMKFSTIEDALMKVQHDQRGLIAFEQERTQMLAYQVDSLKEAMFAQQDAFRKLQEEEEIKRQLLEEQVIQLLQLRATASEPSPVPTQLSKSSQHQDTALPSQFSQPLDEAKSSTTSTTLPVSNLLERSVEEEGGKGLTLGEHSSFVMDTNTLQHLQIEEFWNSVASGDFPASLRPSTLLAGSEQDDEVPQPTQNNLPPSSLSPIPQRASLDFFPTKNPEVMPTSTHPHSPLPPHSLLSACTDPTPLEYPIDDNAINERHEQQVLLEEEEEGGGEENQQGETTELQPLSLEVDGLGVEEVQDLEEEEEEQHPQFATSPMLPSIVTDKNSSCNSSAPASNSFTTNVNIDDFWGSANSLYNDLIPTDSVEIDQENVTKTVPIKEQVKEVEKEKEEVMRKSVESVARDFARSFEAKIEELLHSFPVTHPGTNSNTNTNTTNNSGRDAQIEFLLEDDEEGEEGKFGQGSDSEYVEESEILEYHNQPVEHEPGTEEEPFVDMEYPLMLQEQEAEPEEPIEQEEEEEELEEMTSPLPVFSNHIWPDQSCNSFNSVSQSQSFLPLDQTQDTSGLYSHLKDASRLEDYLDNNWPPDISALDHDEEPNGLPLPVPSPSPPLSLKISSPVGPNGPLSKEKSEVLDSQTLFALSLMGEEEDEEEQEEEEERIGGYQSVVVEEENEDEHEENSHQAVDLANLTILPMSEDVDLYNSLPSPILSRQPSNLSRQYVQEREKEEVEEDDTDEDDD